VGALRAQATAALRGEEADPTRERQTAEQGEGPRVEAGARERDAPDAAADTADATDARDADVAAANAVAVVVEVTAADAVHVDVATGAEVLLLVTRGVRVTAGVLLDQARLVAGVAARARVGVLIDVAVLRVAARDGVAVAVGLGALGPRDRRDGGEQRERQEQGE